MLGRLKVKSKHLMWSDNGIFMQHKLSFWGQEWGKRVSRLGKGLLSDNSVKALLGLSLVIRSVAFTSASHRLWIQATLLCSPLESHFSIHLHIYHSSQARKAASQAESSRTPSKKDDVKFSWWRLYHGYNPQRIF
jgi:hypothetical protein